MTARTGASTYGWLAQWLHWLVAALIVTQFVLGQLAQAAGDQDLAVRQLALLANHKSIGITVLLLASLRICWRWLSGVPQPPTTMPRWQINASRATHWLLYVLIFALPISGWLMSSAAAYSVSWFNLVELPDLIGPSETVKERLVSLHHLLASTLFVVAVVHLLAALKHQFIDRDGVLGRMLSTTSGILFVVVLAGAVLTTTGAGQAGIRQHSDAIPADMPTPQPVAGVTTLPASEASADIASWQIHYPDSYIRFRAEQAGASFEGVWPDWRADIRFLADNLEASSADVEIDVATVSTGDRERDATLLEAAWFAGDAFPKATFHTDAITTAPDGTFAADGRLTVKGITTPVRLGFAVVRSAAGDRWILDGSTRLDRLAMQLGSGEWADPTWVGQFVEVSVHVEADARP